MVRFTNSERRSLGCGTEAMKAGMVMPSGRERVMAARISSSVGIGMAAAGDAAPAREGMLGVGAGEAAREGRADVPPGLLECLSLSFLAAESDLVPPSVSEPAPWRILGLVPDGVSGLERDCIEEVCFIFGFLLRVEVSVPEPASERMADFSLRPEGVVAPDAGGCATSRFFCFSASRRAFSSSSSSSDWVDVSSRSLGQSRCKNLPKKSIPSR